MWMISLLTQGIALFHAEAVLLVNDDQTEFLECHIFLNQGMCANRDHRLPAFQRGAIGGAFTGAHTASQQYGANAEWFKHRSNTAGVLLGQEFGWGHNCALKTIECAHEQCCRCYHCLTGTYIALQ